MDHEPGWLALHLLLGDAHSSGTPHSWPAGGAADEVDLPPTMPPTSTPIRRKRKDPPTAPITIPAMSPAERASSERLIPDVGASDTVGAMVGKVGAVVGAPVGAPRSEQVHTGQVLVIGVEQGKGPELPTPSAPAAYTAPADVRCVNVAVAPGLFAETVTGVTKGWAAPAVPAAKYWIVGQISFMALTKESWVLSAVCAETWMLAEPSPVANTGSAAALMAPEVQDAQLASAGVRLSVDAAGMM